MARPEQRIPFDLGYEGAPSMGALSKAADIYRRRQRRIPLPDPRELASRVGDAATTAAAVVSPFLPGSGRKR